MSRSDAEERPQKNFWNLKAVRSARQIEIGWRSAAFVRFVRNKAVKPEISCSKDKPKWILSVLLTLFFPTVTSTHESANQFEFDVWNYKHQPMNGNTIAEKCTAFFKKVVVMGSKRAI